jgi:hypothetical protein
VFFFKAVHIFGLGVGKQVSDRLMLERSIARRQGFACFADYYVARREQRVWTVWPTKPDRPWFGFVE